MQRILAIFGTRPEAIKMAPVVQRLKEAGRFRVKVAVTGQHRQMLDQVLELLAMAPDHDLQVMTSDQDLFHLTARVVQGLKGILQQEQPDLVLVQGDTTTTLAAALAAFYERIPVGHVEAGLRTRDKYRPFPEEINRHLTTVLADYHFAPTPWARDNLLAEGVPSQRIWVTGNTVIDALQMMAAQVNQEKDRWLAYLASSYSLGLDRRRLLLVTGHRRENFGEGFRNICLALKDIMERNSEVHLVYPVHLNPQVQRPVYEMLTGERPPPHLAGTITLQAGGGGRLSLLPPLDYAPFVFLLSQSYLVLTDSGGLQEEAPALGKPVLVLREISERPEGLWAGTARLVGAEREKIVQEVQELLDNAPHYQAMAQAQNPYGDGQAARRIVQILQELLAPA